MERVFTVRFHKSRIGGFWAEAPALPGCFSQGDTLDEARLEISKAIDCHLRGFLKRQTAVPVESRLRKSFDYEVSVTLPQEIQ